MRIASPLLPPAILREYDEIIPGFSRDLHRDVQKESKHRRSCDSWLIKGGTIRALFGQVCALLITLATLYVALQLGLAGYVWVAAVLVAINLVGLVSAFLGREVIARRQTEKQPPFPQTPNDQFEDEDEDEDETHRDSLPSTPQD